jgi:TonB family protein
MTLSLIVPTIKMSVLIGVVLAAMPLLSKRSAAFRHSVLVATVACALTLPLLGPLVPSWSFTWPASPATSSMVTSFYRATPSEANPAPVVGATFSAKHSSPGWRLPSSGELALIAAAVWLFGFGYFFMGLSIGLCRLTWLARRATPMVEPAWVRALAEATDSFGLRRPVRLLQIDHPSLLAAWGWRTPTVMIPRWARHWTDDRARLVLSHELAHVWRGDWCAQVAAEILRAACWFNPLVWMLCRRLQLESERACDDAVLRRGWDAAEYATSLVDLARALASRGRSASGVLASAMARPAGLERRIHAMLQPHLDRRPLSRVHHLAIAATLFALTFVIAGAAASAEDFASLAGTVLDQTDRVLPDVRLVLTNSSNRSKYEVRSDRDGHFEFIAVPAGDYVLETFLPGFTTVRTTFSVGGAGKLETRFKLSVGSLNETIMVTSPGRALTTTELEARRTVLERRAGRSNKGVGDCADTGSTGGNIRQPRKLKDVRPIYPEALSLAQTGGDVVLDAVIGVDGTIRDVRVAKSTNPGFEQAAIDAVRQWEFDTTLLNCQPIEVNMQVNVGFKIQP